jgi:shikimate dehydrogenase
VVQQHQSERRSVLVGLVGAGIQASRTPALHEREGRELGLDYEYRLIDLDTPGRDASALPEILADAQHSGFAGLNITHPCKQSVIPLLDVLSPEAAALGAVNTVVLHNGRRVGHNTDRSGFERSFRRELADVRRQRVVQFGAGGGGAAVADALLSLGVSELSIIDKEPGRAETLTETMCRRFGPGRAMANSDAAKAVAMADGIVNATPLGMARYPGSALPATMLRPELWVADIVYFPLETELLREARTRGCRTLSGGGMAVFQAADAFRLFTGLEPDSERMLKHFASM